MRKLILTLIILAALAVLNTAAYQSDDGLISVNPIEYDAKTTAKMDGQVVDVYVYSKDVKFEINTPLEDRYIEIYNLDSEELVYSNFTYSTLINCSLPKGNYTVYIETCGEICNFDYCIYTCSEFDSYGNFIIEVVNKTRKIEPRTSILYATYSSPPIMDGELDEWKMQSFKLENYFSKTEITAYFSAIQTKNGAFFALKLPKQLNSFIIAFDNDAIYQTLGVFLDLHSNEVDKKNNVLGVKKCDDEYCYYEIRKLNDGKEDSELFNNTKINISAWNIFNLKEYYIYNAILVFENVTENEEQKERKLIVESVFANNTHIPKKYAFTYCGGQNVNPPLYLKNLSNKAKSLVIVVEDPDANNFLHWLAWNVELIETIPEGVVKREIVNNPKMVQGVNDFGFTGYGGPCPPPGEIHHYYFNVYVLDTMLNLPTTATKDDVLNAMKGHVIQKGLLIGLFP